MIGPGHAGAASVFAIGLAALRPRPPTPYRARRRHRTRCRTHDPSGHLPITPRAKRCLGQSLREALAFQSGYIGVEHLALALIATRSGAAAHILSSIGVSTQRLRTDILNGYRQAS